MIVLTAEQAAEVDRRTIHEVGLPGLVLMETAGRALVRVLEERCGPDLGRGVVVVAGPGNNGGDGFVAARALCHKGVSVTVFLLGSADRLEGDAAHQHRLARYGAVPVFEIRAESDLEPLRDRLAESAVCIDALFGTGLARTLEGLAAAVVEAVNAASVRTIAMDIPSGVNGTSGHVHGTAVQAEATVCAGALKRGVLLYPGASHAGALYAAEIGFPPRVIEEVADGVVLTPPSRIASWIPSRAQTANKGSAGRLAVVAGSRGMSGAAVLSTLAALRAGAGLVTLCLPEGVGGLPPGTPLEALTRMIPDNGAGAFRSTSVDALLEAVDKADAVALGPGAGRDDETIRTLAKLLETVDAPVVVDADGLRALHVCPPSTPERRVVTPHPGEMANLLGSSIDAVVADPIGAARDCAARFAVVALLKGAHTVVAHPDGRVHINWTGNPGMATGGMGDTLTGLIGALLAQGAAPFEAAACGAFLHGRAGDRVAAARGERGLLAHDVSNEFPAALEETRLRPDTIPFPRVL